MGEILLTVDTSTPAGSVAVSRGETLLGEILLNVKSTHTDRLLLTLRQLLTDTGLQLTDVDAFAVVLGPGSFTGLRVGVATVKGLALATGKPALGVSTLQTLAMQVPFPRHPLCVLLDARKNEVYAGLYHCEGGRPVPSRPEVVIAPEPLLDTLDGETLFAGDGSVAYRTLISRRLGSRRTLFPGRCIRPVPRRRGSGVGRPARGDDSPGSAGTPLHPPLRGRDHVGPAHAEG
jgi:tRNA threonylcarbamoyladenosine biosynthesis protein TsaB